MSNSLFDNQSPALPAGNHAPFEYWMLPPGLAQWDEYTHHPPSEWKHRLLPIWIHEADGELAALATEHQMVVVDGRLLKAQLAKLQGERYPNKHEIEAKEYQIIQCRSRLRANSDEQARVQVMVKAWKLRYVQGVVECGFADLMGIMEDQS